MPPGRRRRRKKSQGSSYDGAKRLKVSPALSSFCDLDVPLVLDRSIRNNYADHHQYNTDIDTDAANVVKNKTTGISTTPGSSRKKKSIKLKRASKEEQYNLIDRLKETGYSVIALSHSINGDEFFADKDSATKTIPNYLYRLNNNDDANDHNINKDKQQGDKSNKKRLKVQKSSKKITILKRLNIRIEEASELGNYCINVNNHKKSFTEALQSYDIIAMSPQNDSAFKSICTMSNLSYCDIITLDYTKGRGGIQLPYKLRTSDIEAATNRGLVFELQYGPALTDPKKRKAFVQTARLFLNATLGVKDDHRQRPKIIISSGERVFEHEDRGVFALRSVDDMINFTNIVLGFDPKVTSDAFSTNASWSIQRGYNRRVGKIGSSSNFVDVRKGLSKSLNFEVIDSSHSLDDIIEESKINDDGGASDDDNYNNKEKSESVDIHVEGGSGDENAVEEFDHEEDFLKL